MNYLAHFYLAAPEEYLIVGGFLGDFVKGPLKGNHAKTLELGIQLHRHIDSVTDRHPLQKSIQGQLPKPFYRYSGIISDMLCDHTLALHWSEFHKQPLEDFSQDCFRIIGHNKSNLTAAADVVFERMKSHNWLQSYALRENVYRALTQIGRRLRYENPLAEAGNAIDAIDDAFVPECLEILYDTRRAVQEWRRKHIMEKVL